jgi:glucose-6-phosphate 1-epimerase
MSSSSSSWTKSVVHSASGASCEVHEFGATVISYKTASGQECIFVSRDAKLDGSKAIRGGIPLVFPQFGQPMLDMPQHGFARNSRWTLTNTFDNADSAGMEFTLDLKHVTESRGDGAWSLASGSHDCKLVYLVQVEPEKFTTTLTVENSGSTSFHFQALFHTYYLVQNHAALDPKQCFVKGLEGYNVHDKITSQQYVNGADPVVIDRLTDRVYTPPSSISTGEVCVEIGVGGGHTIHLIATSKVDGQNVPTSCVVWNPHEEKAKEMGDFGDDQYVDMICVEPGMLETEQNVLKPGQRGTLTQVMILKASS